MKKIFLFVAIICAMVGSSCSEGYDDTALRNEINSLELRVAALEELCKQMNTNLTSLQTIVTALQQSDYITNVTPITKDGETVGYTISFAKSGSITIYNGLDGNTPQIGVMKDTDGNYYWTLNGEWLLDDNGELIRAEGKDGANGVNGNDGVSPKLKIENGYWYVSYDNGSTWTQIGDADAVEGENIFEDVDVEDDNVTFTLSDGTTFTLPIFDGNSPVGTAPANNEIWYTTVDGSTANLGATEGFGANIVSNIMYKNGVGVVTFDGNVTTIPFKAFNLVSALNNIKTVILPSGVTSIGEGAFFECRYLKEINLPVGVTSIGDSAFEYCESLVNITIPNSVISIGDEAFYECESLESITIPNSVTTMGDRVFLYCDSLSAFYGKFASSDNRCLIVDGKLKAFAGKGITEYIIPNNVTSIEESVFYNNTLLKKVTISDNVEYIKNSAFLGCISLEEVIIGENVVEIGEAAFQWCHALKSIVVPDNVEYIRGYAFYNCESLAEVTLGGNLLGIGRVAFAYCPIKNIIIPDKVEYINEEAFYYCDLEEVTIGTSVSEIGDLAFGGCSGISKMYCKPVSPPKIRDIFGGTRAGASVFTIYVPTASVSAYKADENWIRFEHYIVGYDFD